MSQCRSKVVDERVAIGAAAPRLVGILLAVSALLAPQTTHFALEFGGIVVNHSMHGDFAMHTRGPRAPRQATEDIARSARLDCPLDGSPPLVDPYLSSPSKHRTLRTPRCTRPGPRSL